MAGKGTAAAAAPGARVTLLLRCFAEPSVSVVVSPCSRQGARLHHAPCPPAARPSRSLTKASSPRAVLSSAVRIYTSNNKGFSFAVTEFCSFPPNIPPSGFSTGFAALRNDPRAPGASAAAPHHPVRAPAGEPRHHLVRSNRSLCFWGVAEPDVPRADKAPFGLKAPLHQSVLCRGEAGGSSAVMSRALRAWTHLETHMPPSHCIVFFCGTALKPPCVSLDVEQLLDGNNSPASSVCPVPLTHSLWLLELHYSHHHIHTIKDV